MSVAFLLQTQQMENRSGRIARPRRELSRTILAKIGDLAILSEQISIHRDSVDPNLLRQDPFGYAQDKHQIQQVGSGWFGSAHHRSGDPLRAFVIY